MDFEREKYEHKEARWEGGSIMESWKIFTSALVTW